MTDRTKALEAARRIEDPDVDTGTIYFVADAKRCARALLVGAPGEGEKDNYPSAKALAWLVCIAEGDREGLVINAHTAKMAAEIRRLLPAREAQREALQTIIDHAGMRGSDRVDVLQVALEEIVACARDALTPSSSPSPAVRDVPWTGAERARAREFLMEKAKIWRTYRQPFVAPAREQKKRDIEEREARFQLANAALSWLWCEEKSADDNPVRDAMEEITPECTPR